MSENAVALALRRRLRAARRRLTLAAVARGALVTAAAVGAAVLAALAAEAGLWLGVGLRTAVFWLLVALLGGLAASLVVVPLLRGAGVLPGLDERSVVRRAGQDYAGVDDRLATLLDLADGRGAGGPDGLRQAALDALGREVERVPFERVRAFGPARRAAPWALVPAALLIGLFAGAPHTVGAAAARLMAPGVYFAPPAPFQLQVEPGDADVTRGASLPVRVVAVGRDLPLAATLEFGRADERATETVRLQPGEDSQVGGLRRPDGSGRAHAFTYTIEDVRADLRYRIEADGVRTEWFRVDAVDRPLVRGVRVTVAPPRYSGRKARTLPEGVGDATGLVGSTVQVQVAFGGPDPIEGWLDVEWEDGRGQRVPLRIGGEAALGRFVLRGAGTYSVRLKAGNGLENTNPARYALGVLGDGPPQIALVEGADAALSAGPRRLVFRVTDDFGFQGGSLVYRVVGSDRARRLRLPVRTRPLDQEVALDWRVPGARPGDAVEFYGEVRDNDAVRGGKTARTPLFTVRFPTLADRLDAFEAERDTAAQALDQLQEEAEESGERFRRLREDLRQSLDPDWEDRRQVEELLREQSDLQRQAQELQQQMDRLSQELQDSDLVDEETQRQFEMMRRVMEELDSPELRDALQRLRDAMERLDMQDMLQQSEEAAQSEEEFRRRLERAMGLMKRLEAAVEMEEAARRADDLAETEERLARETEALREGRPPETGEPETGERGEQQDGQDRQPGEQEPRDGEPRSPAEERERLAEEQRQAREDAEALEQQMEELREQLEDVQRAPTEAVEQMQQQMQQDGGLPQQMEQNAQQLQQNQLQDAQEGQEEMSKQLRRLAREMRQQSQAMQGQQQKVDQAAVRRALEDVLTLSREQERLAVETSEIPSRNPALVPAARRQGELRDGLSAVVDSLRRVARTVPQLGPEVDARAGNARREMERAVERLADRQSGPSVAHQRTAMSHLNELALLLTDLLDQLQNQQQGSGSGGSGSGEGMSPQMMQQMGQRQQQLNERIQRMLNETAGERLSPGEGRRLRQMAEQQEALRRQLQRAIENGGEGLGPNEQSQLQRVEEQMREAAQELRRGRLDGRAAPRQQQILEKLLEAERSVNQRGREEQREAQTGRDRPPERAPESVRTDRPADRVRRDLIRALESGYAPDYQDLIKAYFERLQSRVDG